MWSCTLLICVCAEFRTENVVVLVSTKTWIHAPLFHLSKGHCSSLWPLCSVLSQSMYPLVPSQVKTQEKRVSSSLRISSSQWACSSNIYLSLWEAVEQWETIQRMSSDLLESTVDSFKVEYCKSKSFWKEKLVSEWDALLKKEERKRK
jgi:hypothetical protein